MTFLSSNKLLSKKYEKRTNELEQARKDKYEKK